MVDRREVERMMRWRAKRQPDPRDGAPDIAGYIECPECHQHIPIISTGLEQDSDGDVTMGLDGSEVWAHSFTHDEGSDDA